MSKLYFCGDDHLGMGAYGYNLLRVIKNADHMVKSNDNQSFVIGINAPWGTGKTYFINMMESYLAGKWKDPEMTEEEISEAEVRTGIVGIKDYISNMRVIHYDAWSNDFWDNAFEPFFDTVVDNIAGYEGVDSDELKTAFKAIGRIIAIGFDAYFEKKYGDSYDTLKKMIGEAKKGSEQLINGDYVTKNTFPEYCAFKEAITELKKLLVSVVAEYKKQYGEDAGIVIIIDELDRCRPLFSVQTLEIVKHFFNINGLVFVFALDMSQLQHCVKNVYGDQIDAEGYLERFFNYLSNLPQGNYKPLINIFNKEASAVDEKWKNIEGGLLHVFSEIASRFSLSLRELRIILSSLQMLEQNTLERHKSCDYARILYFYFLSYKYKEPDNYRHVFFKGRTDLLEKLLSDNSTNIPFFAYEGDRLNRVSKSNSEKINNDLCKALVSKMKIKNLALTLFDMDKNGEGVIKDCFYAVNQGCLLYGDTAVNVDNNMTLNYFLYEPDLKSEIACQGKLFELSPTEYLNKQLEMIEFVNTDYGYSGKVSITSPTI